MNHLIGTGDTGGEDKPTWLWVALAGATVTVGVAAATTYNFFVRRHRRQMTVKRNDLLKQESLHDVQKALEKHFDNL